MDLEADAESTDTAADSLKLGEGAEVVNRLSSSPGSCASPFDDSRSTSQSVHVTDRDSRARSATGVLESIELKRSTCELLIDHVLTQLDSVAADRIRDAKSAKSLLTSLIRVVRSALSEGAAVPVARILSRLCYYANARDTGIRSATFRAVRYAVTDAAGVAQLCQTRLVISIVRALERDQKFLWERVQALKVVKLVIQISPSHLPLGVIRSMIAIAQFMPAEPPVPAQSLAKPTEASSQERRPDAPGPGMLDRADYDQVEDKPAVTAPTDNLRRVAIDTIRQCLVLPELTSTMLDCEADIVLIQAVMQVSSFPHDSDLISPIALTFAWLCNYRPAGFDVSRIFRHLVAEFTNSLTEADITRETRARWALSRHIFVSIIRSWAGTFALAQDPTILQSLYACLMHAKSPDLCLSVVALVLEIVCPPCGAEGEDLPELSGRYIRPAHLSHVGLSAASTLMEEDMFQTIMLCYQAQRQKKSRPDAKSGTAEKEMQRGSFSESFIGNSYIASAEQPAGHRSPMRGADEDSGSAELRLAAGLAVPFAIADALHGSNDEPEYYASFWLRVSAHAERSVGFGNIANRSHFLASQGADAYVNTYRAQTLIILLQEGIIRAMSTCIIHDHPLVRLAGSAFAKFILSLSLLLLPPSFSHQVLDLSDLTQLAASCASRCPLPTPRSSLLMQPSVATIPPGHVMQRILRSYGCIVHFKPDGFLASHPQESLAHMGVCLASSLSNEARARLLRTGLVLWSSLAVSLSGDAVHVRALPSVARPKTKAVATSMSPRAPLVVDMTTQRQQLHERHAVQVLQSLVQGHEQVIQPTMLENAVGASDIFVTNEDASFQTKADEIELDEKRANVLYNRLSNAAGGANKSILADLQGDRYSSLRLSALAEGLRARDFDGIEGGDIAHGSLAVDSIAVDKPSTFYGVGKATANSAPRLPGSFIGVSSVGQRWILPLVDQVGKHSWHSWDAFAEYSNHAQQQGGILVAAHLDTATNALQAIHRAADALRSIPLDFMSCPFDVSQKQAVELRLQDVVASAGTRGPKEEVNVMGLTSASAPQRRLVEGYKSGIGFACKLLQHVTELRPSVADTHHSRGAALIHCFQLFAEALLCNTHDTLQRAAVNCWLYCDIFDSANANTFVCMDGYAKQDTRTEKAAGQPTSSAKEPTAASAVATTAGIIGKASDAVAERARSFLTVANQVTPAPVGAAEEIRALGLGKKLARSTSWHTKQDVKAVEVEALTTIPAPVAQPQEGTGERKLVASPSGLTQALLRSQMEADREAFPAPEVVEADSATQAMMLSDIDIVNRRRQLHTLRCGYMSHIREDERYLDWEQSVSSDAASLAITRYLTGVAAEHSVPFSIVLSAWRMQQALDCVAGLPTHFLVKNCDAEDVVTPSIQIQRHGVDISDDKPYDYQHVLEAIVKLWSSSPRPGSMDVRKVASLMYDKVFKGPTRAMYRDDYASHLRSQLLRISHVTESGTLASQTMLFGHQNHANIKGNKDKDILGSQVSSVMASIRVSKVTLMKDWRLWDWGTIAVILDHHLSNHAILTEVLTRTTFMHRIGEFFSTFHVPAADGVCSAGNFASLPWLPASLRFLRVARQWMQLLVQHPAGRDVIARKPIKGAMPEDLGQNMYLQIMLAIWCTYSKALRRLVRSNAVASRPAQGFVAAAAAKLFSVAGKGKATGGSLTDRENVAAKFIKEVIGSQASGDPFASLFARSTFTTTMSRELLTFLAVGFGSPHVVAWLNAVKVECIFDLPDAPSHAAILADAYAAVKKSLDIPESFLLPSSDIRLTLIHLPSASHREYLARQLLLSIDFSVDAFGLALLFCWIAAYRPKELPVAVKSVAGEPVASPPSALPVSTAEGPEERGPELLLVTPEFACFCVNHLRVLLRHEVGGFSLWGISVLVSLLNHFDSNIVRSSLSILTEACLRSRVYLMAFISRAPNLNALPPLPANHPLLLELSSESMGFQLLLSAGLITTLMNEWLRREHVTYVLSDELQASSRLLSCGNSSDHGDKYGAADPKFMDWVASFLLPQGRNVLCAGSVTASPSFLSMAYENLAAAGVIEPAPSSLKPDGSDGCLPVALNPLPMRVPCTPTVPGCSHVNLSFERLCQADRRFDADLESFCKLPWRVEIWAEWEKAVVGTSNPASPLQRRSSRPDASAQGVRQLMRMEISADTFVDLSAFEPELVLMRHHDAAVNADAFVSAACVDSQGVKQPFLLPPHATVKAALYCGVHPISSFGDIPIAACDAFVTHSSANHGATRGPATQRVAVYDSVDSALTALFEACNTPSGHGKVDKAKQKRPSAAVGIGREAEPDDDDDDNRSERSATSRRTDARKSLYESRRSLLPAPAQKNVSTPDQVDSIDDYATRVRRRNAAAVASLALPVTRRHAFGWTSDIGLVELDDTVALRARSASLTDIAALSGDTQVATSATTSRLPDYLAGGPDANTVVFNTPNAASHSTMQAGALLRATGDRFACWTSCTATSPRESISFGRTLELQQVVIVPPGSNARFTFSISQAAGEMPVVRLLAVEFGVLFLPKRLAKLPAYRSLYSALACHTSGVSAFRDSSHMLGLLDVLFQCSAEKAGHMAGVKRCPSSLSLQRRAALQSLAQFGSTEQGFDGILEVCPDFCVQVDALARGVRLVKRSPQRQLPGHQSAPRSIWYDAKQERADPALRASSVVAIGTFGLHVRGWTQFTSMGWCMRKPDESRPAGAFPVAVPQVPSTAYILPVGKQLSVKAVDDSTRPESLLCGTKLAVVQPAWNPILRRISELSSKVTQKEGRAFLLKRRLEAPDLFADPGLYLHVNVILSRYNLALPIRRFIHSLFDRVSFSDGSWAYTNLGVH